jgi:hypothetical protein
VRMRDAKPRLLQPRCNHTLSHRGLLAS